MTAHVQDHLSAYLDGELPAGERAAVETHLRSCPECARHLDELRAVDATARDMDVVDAPPGYFDSLPARVRGRLPAPRPRRPPVWVWAAAAGLALAVLTPLLKTTSPLPDAARDEGESPGPAPADKAVAERKVAPERGLAAPEPRGSEGAREREGEKRRAKPSLPAATPAPAVAGRVQDHAAAAAPPPPARAPAQVQKHSGPWAQSPTASQAQSAARPQEAQKEAAPEPRTPAAPEGKSDRDQARAGALADSAAPSFAQAPGEDARYRALLTRQPASAEAARKLHDDWKAFALAHPDGPRADKARVRALDALLAAFRRGGDPRDRDRLREEAEVYLERSDAAQPARVHAILAAAGLPREP